MATIIRLGPGGPLFGAGKINIAPNRVSGARGNNAQFAPGVMSPRSLGNVGVPMGLPTAQKKKGKFVANMLRIAVEEKWGHHYGYFDVLLANDLDERHVLYKGQPITMPARARRAKIMQATKWRRYFGSS